MGKYRVTSYKTISGTSEIVHIGDHTSGEWIIYQKGEPKFHVNCFRSDSESDRRIKYLLNNGEESIESIISKINHAQNIHLDFGRRTWIDFEVKSKIRFLDLSPLPIEWIENID